MSGNRKRTFSLSTIFNLINIHTIKKAWIAVVVISFLLGMMYFLFGYIFNMTEAGRNFEEKRYLISESYASNLFLDTDIKYQKKVKGKKFFNTWTIYYIHNIQSHEYYEALLVKKGWKITKAGFYSNMYSIEAKKDDILVSINLYLNENEGTITVYLDDFFHKFNL